MRELFTYNWIPLQMGYTHRESTIMHSLGTPISGQVHNFIQKKVKAINAG